MVRFKVVIKRKLLRNLRKVPENVREKFFTLAQQLAVQGPVAWNWPHFSGLGSSEYHCHLSYDWVACWRHEKETIIIEVTYVGSRENAPY